MRRWIAFIAIALMVVAAPASAQTFGFGVHAGVSVPTGDYGADDNNQAGLANLGFMGGVDLFLPLGMAPGLSWLTSASAVAHGVDDDALGVPGVEAGGYLIFPLMTGLRFDIPAGPVGVFAQGQIGYVLVKGPSFEGDGESVDADFNGKFGFNVGGGVQVNPNIYVGARYFPLGDVDINYPDFQDGQGEQNVSFVDVFVGFAVR